MKFWKLNIVINIVTCMGNNQPLEGKLLSIIMRRSSVCVCGGGFTLFSAPQDAELITLANVCCDSWIIIEISLIPFQTLLTNCIKLCKAVAKRWFPLSSVVCTDM